MLHANDKFIFIAARRFVEFYFEYIVQALALLIAVSTIVIGCKQQSRELAPTSSALIWLGVLGAPTTVNPTSVALGVSNDGIVVGWSYDGSGRQRAWMWSPVTPRLHDLSTLARDAGRAMAYDISADGKVAVGWAVDASGRRHAAR